MLSSLSSAKEQLSIQPNLDVPLAQTTMFFAHNAYNSAAYGAMFPNQSLSITELLDMGVKGLELDLYYNQGEIRLCHLLCADYGLGLSMKLTDALKEVSEWMQKHPGEVVFLKLEDHIDKAGQEMLGGYY
jgi:hypothetical protein